jgi:hypothetical protein
MLRTIINFQQNMCYLITNYDLDKSIYISMYGKLDVMHIKKSLMWKGTIHVVW